jgi:hypothetical protein
MSFNFISFTSAILFFVFQLSLPSGGPFETGGSGGFGGFGPGGPGGFGELF